MLFYGFTPVLDPDAVRLWQRALCEKLGLRGRILISTDGINATVGGEITRLKQYLKTTREYAGFKDIDIKWSDGGADDFPRLSVKAREEIVSFGAPGELKVDEHGVVGGGTHLQPEATPRTGRAKTPPARKWSSSTAATPSKPRSASSRTPWFPDVATTHDFIKELDSGKYDALKDKPVVTYCTGGIRCEVLSSLMVNRGFKEVYQMDGGIVRYGEAFKDTGPLGGLAVRLRQAHARGIQRRRQNHRRTASAARLPPTSSKTAPTSAAAT